MRTMRLAITKVRTILGLCAAFTLSACTFSDSLLNSDIRSLWAAPGNATAHPVVVFATDREPDDTKFGFGLHWDAQTHCGVAELSIPSAFVAGVTPAWPGIDKRDDLACGGRSEMAGFAAALARQLDLRHCHAALMFVHGYNQTFRSALLRAGQIATDTQWPCASALMSWSSEGKFDRYAADIERSGYAVPIMIELLRATSASGIAMSIIAHSMGARVTLSALSALGGYCRTLGKPIVDELILAAPDVSSELYNDDFGHFLERSVPCVHRVTVYASAGDMVLIAAESAHGGIPRAGREPMSDQTTYVSRAPGHVVDVVDATLAPGDNIGHGYFVQSYEMMQDMMWVLAGEPIEARATQTAQHAPTVFCYAKGQPRCDGTTGTFALHVSPARRPDWLVRAMRSLVPITSPFQ